VVPAHSFKYAATLQGNANHANPVLIRIDTQSGHGASNTSKALDTAADIYSFLMYNLGVEPSNGDHPNTSVAKQLFLTPDQSIL
jgi:prolyl oligopeptidase